MKTVRAVVDLGPFTKRSLAVELCREGKLSLGKAAELAGIKRKWEILMLLSERGMPLDHTLSGLYRGSCCLIDFS